MSQRKAQEKQYATVLEYKRVFGSPDGQKVLHDLMDRFHLLRATHFRGDSHESAFRDGERHVVITIMQILKQNPEKLMELLKQGESE